MVTSDTLNTSPITTQSLFPCRIGMAMPKKAPYKPNFDRVVRLVVEAGLVRNALVGCRRLTR